MSIEEKSSLESLRQSISSMSNEDLHELIAEVRDSRKRPKKPEKMPTSVKKGKKGIGRRTVDLEKLVGSMTDKQKEILIAKLEGMQE